MNQRSVSVFLTALGLVVLFLAGASSATQDVLPQPAGMDVQARGPVHEAFAEPMNTQPEMGPVVPKAPPDPIPEVPPDQRPEGDNVQWIGGYWSWDNDSNDFIWVSGCWRDLPPGQRWVPGHWQEIDRGWIWVSGFWASTEAQQVQYLPPPPPTLEQGPSAPAPNPNSIYAPGCWVYRENRYFWRPGHWVPFRDHWVWVPARYVWTPVGCIFVDDYWDYALDERGLLFAPCRFDLRVWGGRPYIPAFVIEPEFLVGAMFVNTFNRHYYFGDYFEDRYQKQFVPWVDYHPIPGVLDHNFSYFHHLHAGQASWENGIRELYRGRRVGEVPRPPRTFAQQQETIRKFSNDKTGNVQVHKNIKMTNLQNVSVLSPAKEVHNVKVVAVPKEEQARAQKMAAQMHEGAVVRRDAEAKKLVEGGIPVKHTDVPHVAKLPAHEPPPKVAAPPRPAIHTPPPKVTVPKHEERPIPKYEPPHPPAPPKHEKKNL
jgi:WXXGXW repeat (2 copies)